MLDQPADLVTLVATLITRVYVFVWHVFGPADLVGWIRGLIA